MIESTEYQPPFLQSLHAHMDCTNFLPFNKRLLLSFRFPNLPYEIDKFLNVLYSAFWNDFKNKIDCMGIKFLKIELNLVVLAVLNSMPFWITRNAKPPKIHVFNYTALYCSAKTSERAWGEGGPRKILNFNGKLSHVFCSHIWLGTPESFWGSQDR